MRVQAAGAVIVVMLVGIVVMLVIIMRGVVSAKVTQMHARQRLHSHRRQCAAFDDARQKGFHVRADPVKQLDFPHAPYVGWAQRVVVGGRTWRQKHLGLAHAVLHSRCNQLQWLDTGQHPNLGLGRGDDQQADPENSNKIEKTAHSNHSYKPGTGNIITSLANIVAAHAQYSPGQSPP
ncbi:hypothetical protein APX70_05626 [Pseudomonas syringae pv. maculicola]|uniref:Uncharacterized protein n=1 Tax=Pseudomonas syringae pv. maculicola TaxID=59511 RepID=A0A3M2XRP6_PSEYM|nr:hypothetical protein APX70_05626 [Pseudomonas syringae pv. maculicola]